LARAPSLAPLFARLGVEISAPRIDEALTHPSAASAARRDYERLEFLGDRVLGLLIAEALHARFPDEPEGRLALRLNALVRRETVAGIAGEIGLGRYLRLAQSESHAGGRRRDTILCDAMEAVIAAVYLEHGLSAVRDTVLRLWQPQFEALAGTAPQDAKSTLQEWAQARGMAPPAYVTTGRTGPDHAPKFTVEARLETGAAAAATAPSKRAAEQAAAATLLERLPDD
jgi:ribonuclease-3